MKAFAREFKILLAVVTCLTVACEDEPTQVRTAELPAGRPGLPTPDQVVENGEHIITIEGVKKALLNAEQLYFYNDTGKVYGDTIQVNFYDEAGAFVSMLTAKTGEMDQSSQMMIARGDVVVRGRESVIRTEELTYDPAQNRISSDQPTDILQRGNQIRGEGVEADPTLTDIKIRGGSAVLITEPDVEEREAVQDTSAPDAGNPRGVNSRDRPPEGEGQEATDTVERDTSEPAVQAPIAEDTEEPADAAPGDST